jgi:hypothetical protein
MILSELKRFYMDSSDDFEELHFTVNKVLHCPDHEVILNAFKRFN